MAYVTQPDTGLGALKLDLSAKIYSVMQRLDDYRAYRETLVQLRELDNNQLADLGLSRSDIQRTAREAVYGV